MLDIKWIRENPEALDAALAKRGAEAQAQRLIAMDEARRAHIGKVQDAQARRNAASKEIGAAMGQGDAAAAERIKAEVAQLKAFLGEAEATERSLNEALNDALSRLPNVPADDVPVGPDESGNVEVRVWGEPKTEATMGFAPKEHYELGEGLGLMDFEAAAKISGARFTVLKGQLARLERALGQFMLDRHTVDNGYTEINPPLLVKDETFHGTGQLPKFEEDLFFMPHGSGRLGLIPTAEVPMTNLVAGDIVPEKELPYRFTALTPCFRSEAGSAGRDTRGMLRQHQFMKVELVSITTPEQSADEHERMTSCAQGILESLGIPYRTVVLCTGDMGFGAQKTYDIEAWLPGQNAYREISSCSNCGDFQARRMNARCRPDGEKQTRFVHTLNGSGIAVGRALIAVMENYQNADGSITVPEALRPYMGGLDRIGVA